MRILSLSYVTRLLLQGKGDKGITEKWLRAEGGKQAFVLAC